MDRSAPATLRRDDAPDVLTRAGVGRGELLAIAVDPEVGVGLATAAATFVLAPFDAELVHRVDRTLRPRWVMWSAATAAALVQAGVRLDTSWDLAAVQRLLDGGWWHDPGPIHARLHGLDPAAVPALAPVDLFSQAAAAARDPE
jgi:DNA polymerase I